VIGLGHGRHKEGTVLRKAVLHPLGHVGQHVAVVFTAAIVGNPLIPLSQPGSLVVPSGIRGREKVSLVSVLAQDGGKGEMVQRRVLAGDHPSGMLRDGKVDGNQRIDGRQARGDHTGPEVPCVRQAVQKGSRGVDQGAIRPEMADVQGPMGF